MAKSARQIAFEALMRVQENAAYSNITLNSLLSKSSISNRDKAFASMLSLNFVPVPCRLM